MRTLTDTRAPAARHRGQPQGSAISEGSGLSWRLGAVCTFFPITAILHHRVFVRPHCMTNLLSTTRTTLTWLGSDPSPWLGLAAALAALFVVTRAEQLRSWVSAIPLSFLPLSIWLWDIPGTSLVCPLFHDGKIGLRSWHLYLLGAAMYLPIVAFLMRGKTMPDRVPAIPLAVRPLPASGRPVGAWYAGPTGAAEPPPDRHLPRP